MGEGHVIAINLNVNLHHIIPKDTLVHCIIIGE